MAQRFGCEYHTDYEAMFARDDIDVIIICTPNKTHASIGIEAARSGKHVIVEKPIDSRLEATGCADTGLSLCKREAHMHFPASIRSGRAASEGSR